MKKRKKHLQVLKTGHLIILLFSFCVSCKNNRNAVIERDSYECSGIGCGKISLDNGHIVLFSEIDTSTYLVINIKKQLSTIEIGDLTLPPTDTNQVNNALSNVFILDFNTKEKVFETIAGDIKGYIYPCSDMISSSHVPDTLNFIDGNLNIHIQETKPKEERDYFINLVDCKFSKNNIAKQISSFKRKIIFIKGNPG